MQAKFHQNNLPHLVPDALLNRGLKLSDARNRLLLVELLEHLAAAVGITAFFQLGELVVQGSPQNLRFRLGYPRAKIRPI